MPIPIYLVIDNVLINDRRFIWKRACLFTKDGKRIAYTFVRLFQKAVTNENISPLKEDGQLKIQYNNLEISSELKQNQK